MVAFCVEDLAPLVVSLLKYPLFILGRFNLLSNDGLGFISSNQQVQSAQLPSNAFNVFCSLVANTFYVWNPNTDTRNRYLLEKDMVASNSTTIGLATLWIQQNVFLVNMSCVIFLVGLLTLVYFGVQLCKHDNMNVSYLNNVIRIMLVSYYSLTNMALIYLIGVRDSSALTVMAIAVLFFATICIPLYCINILRKHSNNLHVNKIRKDFGCLYLQYKQGYAYFTLILLFKQCMYSIVFVLSHFNMLHWIGCLLIQAVLNISFIVSIMYISPFVKKLHQLQALITSGLKIVIIIVGGIVKTRSVSVSSGTIIQILYGSIICVNIICFAIPYMSSCNLRLQHHKASDTGMREKEKEKEKEVAEYVTKGTVPKWAVLEYIRSSSL